jgi:hypothetical protein
MSEIDQQHEIYIAREERLAARRVAGEMVILSADDSSLYVLNELGALLWEAADGATPLREIVRRVICEEYEVDQETGLRDAESFVRQLAEHGVLRVGNAPGAGER